MKKIASFAVVTFAFVLQPAVFAQSPASNKAFFARDLDGVTLAAVGSNGASAPVTLYSLPATVKTSNGGALSATLSMEAALWTYNLTTAIVNGGKASSSSRAAIKAWVEVDGQPMEPGLVVTTLDGYSDASTQAAIGKSTLVVEEQQNWGKQQ